MNLNDYYVNKKVSLKDEYRKWCENEASTYAEGYIGILRSIADMLDFNVDFSFDEHGGSASAYVNIDDLYYAIEHHDCKTTYRQIYKKLQSDFDSLRKGKLYWNKTKSRRSNIFGEDAPNVSGISIEGVFWWRYAELLKKNGSWLKDSELIELDDAQEIIERFYNDCLAFLMNDIIKCYAYDMSEENFINFCDVNDIEYHKNEE